MEEGIPLGRRGSVNNFFPCRSFPQADKEPTLKITLHPTEPNVLEAHTSSWYSAVGTVRMSCCP